MWNDCLQGAKNKITLDDYKLYCSRSTNSAMSYPDRMNALNELVENQMIVLVENHLELGVLSNNELLKSHLEEGDENAWGIVELFPKTKWKFDPFDDSLAQIGLKGERAVIEKLFIELPTDLHPRIVHHSVHDDSLGYDISAPSIYKNQEINFLEVKTTTRPSDALRFHISRNEFDTGGKIPRWNLILTQLYKSNITFVGHLDHSELVSLAPKEVEHGFKWESCVFEIHKNDLTPGLP